MTRGLYAQTALATTSSSVSANSTVIDIANAKQVTITCKRANHSAGSSAFTVQVSNDGTNWIPYNKLIDNVTNSNVQNLTRIATKTLSSNTQDFITMSPEDSFPFMRVNVTITTDGDATAYVSVVK